MSGTSKNNKYLNARYLFLADFRHQEHPISGPRYRGWAMIELPAKIHGPITSYIFAAHGPLPPCNSSGGIWGLDGFRGIIPFNKDGERLRNHHLEIMPEAAFPALLEVFGVSKW